MEEIEKPISKSYPPLILMIDDLEKIISTFPPNVEVEILADNEFKFDSIDELVKYYAATTPKVLSIKSSRPYCTINFRRFSAEFYISNTSSESCKIYHNIDDILSRRTRKPRFIFSKFFTLAYYFFWILISFPFRNYIQANMLISRLIFLALSLAVLVIFWTSYIASRHYTTIKLIRRREYKNFFQRNRDTIGLAIISCLIGTIIGGGIGFFLTKNLEKVYGSNVGTQNCEKSLNIK